MDGHYYGMPPTGGYYTNGQPLIHTEYQETMLPQENMMLPEDFVPRIHQSQTMSSETLNSYSDVDESNRLTMPVQSGARPKRRPPPGPDHVKHRRTRSGCYTCRQRRVKCDETHPICERCRKGKRECVYPELTPSTATRPRRESKTKDEGSPSSEDFDFVEGEKLPPIKDEDDDAETASSATFPGSATSGPGEHRKLSDVSSHPSSPMVRTPREGSTGSSRTGRRPSLPRQNSRQKIRARSAQGSRWSHLSKDVRFYLDFHRKHLTYHHYALKHDSTDFLKTTFLEIAIGHEPLLYAICAFSAYHHTLIVPDGRLQNFLYYYNKSVQALRLSLAKSPRHSIPTLLTILQLATFEEYLGDWVNLMGHQRAALEILTELFTPQSIMQSETHRKIISWYIRFELFTGFMSGYETVLPREWHLAVAEFYIKQARDRPQDLACLFEEKFARSRLVAIDIAMLSARKGKGTISDEQFGSEVNKIGADLARMEKELCEAFQDTRTYVKDFPNAPASEKSIVDSTDPEFLWAGELFTWNFILIDFWAIHMLFKSQIAQFNPVVSHDEVVRSAYKVCKMFEALQYSDVDNRHLILGSQASIGMAVTLLPIDEQTTMWCRRKYAAIETCGYMYPSALRKRMSDIWGADVTRWWLPNDEGFLPILQQIREFADDRASAPRDIIAEDLRDMKGLFSVLSLDDAEARELKSHSSGTGSDLYDMNHSGTGSGQDAPWSGFESSPEMKDGWP